MNTSVLVVNLKPFPSSCISAAVGCRAEVERLSSSDESSCPFRFDVDQQIRLVHQSPHETEPVCVSSLGPKITWICIIMVCFSLKVTNRRL